jgi:hypothetical protein
MFAPAYIGRKRRGEAPPFSLSCLRNKARVPHISDFLGGSRVLTHFMRLSLKKGALAVSSSAAYRKFGVSRSFFARCGIPQTSTQPSPLPTQPIRDRTGAPCSLRVHGPKKKGQSPAIIAKLLAQQTPGGIPKPLPTSTSQKGGLTHNTILGAPSSANTTLISAAIPITSSSLHQRRSPILHSFATGASTK